MIAELIDFFTLHREEMTTIGWLSGLVVSFFTGSAFKHFRKYMTDRSYNKVLGLDSEGSGGFLHIRSSSDGYERMPFDPESGYILLIKATVPNGSRIIHLVCGFTQDNTTRGIEVFESKGLYKHLKKTKHEGQYALLLDCDRQSNPDWNHVHDFTEYAFPTIK